MIDNTANEDSFAPQTIKTFDQRASHFGAWCLAQGFTDESLRRLQNGDEVAVLACYLFTVAHHALRGAKQKAQGKPIQADGTASTENTCKLT
jgi:hypothetical protein